MWDFYKIRLPTGEGVVRGGYWKWELHCRGVLDKDFPQVFTLHEKQRKTCNPFTDGKLCKPMNRADIHLHFDCAITISVRLSHTMVKIFHHALSHTC